MSFSSRSRPYNSPKLLRINLMPKSTPCSIAFTRRPLLPAITVYGWTMSPKVALRHLTSKFVSFRRGQVNRCKTTYILSQPLILVTKIRCMINKISSQRPNKWKSSELSGRLERGFTPIFIWQIEWSTTRGSSRLSLKYLRPIRSTLM